MKMIAHTFLACLLCFGATAAEVGEEEMEAARKEVERAREALIEATAELRRTMPEAQRSALLALDMARRQERPMIGVVLDRSRDSDGVRIAAVTPGGPSDKKGLKTGDEVLSINGHRLEGPDAVDDAYELLEDMEEGDEFELEIRTADGKRRTETVVAEMHSPRLSISLDGDYGIAPMALRLSELRQQLDKLRESGKFAPAIRFDDDRFVWNFGWRWSGLEMARINPELGRYFGVEEGALVLDVEDLDEADLRPGDVILSVDDEAVKTPRDVMRRLRDFDAGDEIALNIMRDHKRMEVTVTAPEPRSFGYSYSWSTDDEN